MEAQPRSARAYPLSAVTSRRPHRQDAHATPHQARKIDHLMVGTQACAQIAEGGVRRADH